MIDSDNPHLNRQPPPDMVQCDRYFRLSRRDPREPGGRPINGASDVSVGGVMRL